MPEDRDEEEQETYHKVDKRVGHGDEEAATEPAAEPDAEPDAEATAEEPRRPAGPPAGEEAPPEATPDEAAEALQIDMYGILRMVFGMCVEQAWVHLGLQLAPGAKETKADLAQARLAIDTVAYIKDALGTNLSAAEQREVEQMLATLRMNYIQRT